jgi:hypothetical protein
MPGEVERGCLQITVGWQTADLIVWHTSSFWNGRYRGDAALTVAPTTCFPSSRQNQEQIPKSILHI